MYQVQLNIFTIWFHPVRCVRSIKCHPFKTGTPTFWKSQAPVTSSELQRWNFFHRLRSITIIILYKPTIISNESLASKLQTLCARLDFRSRRNSFARNSIVPHWKQHFDGILKLSSTERSYRFGLPFALRKSANLKESSKKNERSKRSLESYIQNTNHTTKKKKTVHNEPRDTSKFSKLALGATCPLDFQTISGF